MGMSYEQFWDEPPFLAVVYRKAFRLKRELENERAWLAGLYVYDAVAVSISNAFSKRGQKKQQYMEKPIDLFPLTKSEMKRREAEEQAKMQQAMKAMIKKQQEAKKKAKQGD